MIRRACSVFSVSLSIASIPAVAMAETAEPGVLESLVYPALNLAILLAVLFYFGRKPIRSFFVERRGQIREELERAAKMKAEAEERYAQWQRRLVDLDTELESIRAAARERAEIERDRILTEAEAAAERVRADAHAAVEQELRRAREQLRREAADLAIELAAQRLREQITPADHDRLLDEFVTRIERGPDLRYSDERSPEEPGRS
ncbi:MAG: ATP synthase F0 subunit B [Myxococcota bacterium]